MNFGQNLLTWFSTQAQSLVLLGIVVVGLVLLFKREFSKLIGFVFVALIAVVAVYNPMGIKDMLLSLGNQIIGGG